MKAEDLAKNLQSATPVGQKSDSAARVDVLIQDFAKEHTLSAEMSEKLRSLINAAVDERLAEHVDVRVGRVLGSALAHL